MNTMILAGYQMSAKVLYDRQQAANADSFDALPSVFESKPQAEDQGPALTGETARNFMLAGNATFTATSLKTGVRYTFKVKASKDATVHFVSLLTGSDNESDYTYMGIIGNNGFRLTGKSRYKADSAPVLAFGWIYRHLTASGTVPGVEIHHEGRCGRCGRKLTVPSSIETGLGPECAEKMAA